MRAINRYRELADEVISLYETYQVRNYTVQGLEDIKRLQRDVQTFNPQNIENELIADYPNAPTLQRRLDFVEMKLGGYLIDCPISGDDLLGDGGIRLKHYVAKLGQKAGQEYAIRLHSILDFLNYDSRVIIEMIERLRAMDAKQNDEQETTDGIILPEELNTDEAKQVLSEAVKAGLMQPLDDGIGYKWYRSNALLAYLTGKIYCGDKLEQDTVTREWIVKRGSAFFPETSLMSFFVNKDGQAIKNLGQSRFQLERPPKGYEDVNRLFDEAT